MKVLIIDDEPPVIAVIKYLVKWEEYGIDRVLTCNSAEEAEVILAKENPEIILSDINLPGLSGLELIEKLRSNGLNQQVIFISAYDKFTYAQQAIRLECIDYLLKPVDRGKINRAVEKAVHEYRTMLDHEKNTRLARTMLEGNRNALSQNILAKYIRSGCDPVYYDEFCRHTPWLSQLKMCRMGVLNVGYISEKKCSRTELVNRINEVLFQNQAGVAALYEGNSEIAILFKIGGVNEMTVIQEIFEKLHELTDDVFHLGISDEIDFPDHTMNGYRQAQERMKAANLFSEEDQVERTAAMSNYAVSYAWIEKVLFAYVNSGTEENLRRTVREFAETTRRNRTITIKQFENLKSMYASIRDKWIDGILAEDERAGETWTPEEMNRCVVCGVFDCYVFEQILQEDLCMLRCLYENEKETLSVEAICRQVQNYLQKHYRDDISFDKIAEMYGISQGYLSKIYKKETGDGLTNSLTRIRMEEACRLLREDIPPGAVGRMVGIDDPKYFSRVFKKTMGMTPSEYKGAENE